MFNFLKSKKGFTLVELMIVVVIMAILVAVAVPIYSAVTENARRKTCVGNQREIISIVGNWLMIQGKDDVKGSMIIETNEDGSNGTISGFTNDGGTALTDDEVNAIKKLFKTVPFCPVAKGEVTITFVLPTTPGGFSTVKTQCDTTTHKFETN